MTRSFWLISILVAMVWSASALADGGWGTFYLNPARTEYTSGDPGTACSISADQQYGTASLGTEARPSSNWYTKHCFYQHFLAGGAYANWYDTTFQCPVGLFRHEPGLCLPYPERCKDQCEPGEASIGDPVLLSSGTKFEEVVDYASGGSQPLEFRRYYRSIMSSPAGQVGMGWSATYDRALILRSATSVEVYTESGAFRKFAKSGGVWNRSYNDMTDKLVEVTSGTVFEFTNGADRTDRFELVSGAFRLTQVRWRNGYQQDLAYVNNKLSTVTDSFGRVLTFTWDMDVIASVEAPGQYKISYTYDRVTAGPSGLARGSELLVKVKRQSLSSGGTEEIGYLYESPAYRHLLTGVVDGNGHLYSTTEYDQYGRVIATGLAGGADLHEIEYDDVNNTRTVTNPLGKQAVYHFSRRPAPFSRPRAGSMTSSGGCCRAWALPARPLRSSMTTTATWSK